MEKSVYKNFGAFLGLQDQQNKQPNTCNAMLGCANNLDLSHPPNWKKTWNGINWIALDKLMANTVFMMCSF